MLKYPFFDFPRQLKTSWMKPLELMGFEAIPDQIEEYKTSDSKSILYCSGEASWKGHRVGIVGQPGNQVVGFLLGINASRVCFPNRFYDKRIFSQNSEALQATERIWDLLEAMKTDSTALWPSPKSIFAIKHNVKREFCEKNPQNTLAFGKHTLTISIFWTQPQESFSHLAQKLLSYLGTFAVKICFLRLLMSWKYA